MADEDKKARIVLEFDNGEFKVKVDDSISQMEKFGSSGESAFKRVAFNATLLNQTLELGKKLWEFTSSMLAKPVEAAEKQEVAIHNLNQALANAGTYSKSASMEMQEFAEQMSRTSRFSDETVLGLEAYARNLTKSNEQAVKLTRAALELSAATGIDAHDAVQRLGLSLNGINARLDRVVPATRGMTAAMLASGSAIDAVNRQFAGSAAGGIRTFEGLSVLLKNGLEELYATIGRLITNSPGVKAVMTMIADGLFRLTDSLKGLKGDVVGDLIKQFFELGKAVITYGMAPLEMLSNVGKIVIDGIKLSIQTFITELAMIPSYIAQYVVGPITSLFSKDAGDAVKDFAKNTRDTLLEETSAMGTELGDALGKAMDFSASSKALTSIEALENQYNKLRTSIKGVEQANKDAAGKTGLPVEIQKMVQSGIVSTLSSSFAALGGALAKGQNAMAAFGKAFLAAIGQMAIQIGTFMVQIGLGYATMIYIPPWAAAGAMTVIKGLALITLGGALAASGGGGGETASSGGGGGGSSVAPTAAAPEPSSESLHKVRGDIVFYGPIFNTRETQQTIVDLVRKGSDITDWNIVGPGGKPYT